LPYFVERSFEGAPVRLATILKQSPLPFYVTVGQTTIGRDAMLLQLVAATLLPLGVVLVVLVFGIQRLVGADLAPLVRLERDLLQRDARDLAPVHVESKVRDFVRLGESFNSLLATIRRAVVAQREFAGNIAHELRTPLSGIRALAEFGLRDGGKPVMKEQLEEIIRTQDKASRLVDQLLALAFAEEVSGTLKREPVRLDIVVREALLRFIARTDAQGIDLGASGLDAPVEVLGNAALLEGVVNNLLDNACRHAFGSSPGGQPQLTVSVEAKEGGAGTGARVTLSVIDNGIGLPETRRADMMQRWRRTSREPMLREGAGLGLAIVSEYARLLGARLSLHAGPDGTGLSVSIELDRA
jgi:two-component system sensor histidine kinase TctE